MTKPKRRWLRRLGFAVLGCIALLVIFHRPLLRAGIHFAAIKGAASQHIPLTFDIEGTVLTNLVLKNVRASGEPGTPLEKVSVGELRASYSPVALARHGIAEFLRSVELKDAEIVLRPVEKPRKERPRKEPDIGAILRDIVQSPTLAGERVSIQNLNLLSRTPDGDLEIRSANVLIDRFQPGFVSVAQIQIPKLPAWKNISATTSFTNRNLILRDLKIDEPLQFKRIELDASKGGENVFSAAISGELFGGSLQVSVIGNNLGHDNPSVTMNGSLDSLEIDRLISYFNPPAKPAPAKTGAGRFEFAGDPNVPATWTAHATSVVNQLAVGDAAVDVTIEINAANGSATAKVEGKDGTNALTLTAKSALPKRVQDFPRSELDGQIQIAASELSRFSPDIAAGTISGGGKFGLRRGEFTADLDATGSGISGTKFAFSKLDLKLELTRLLTANRDHPAPLDDLQTRFTASFQEAQLDKYALDSGSVSLTTENEQLHVETLDLQRSENAIQLSGSASLPRDLKAWAATIFDATFSIAAPSLNAFNAEPDLAGLKGGLDAKGSLSHRNEVFNGKVTATGTKLGYGEFASDTLDVDVAVEKSVAHVNAINLALNATDGVIGSGNVELRAPFVYDGKLRARVHDLATFNPVLKAAGVKDAVSGSLAIDWEGSGKPALIQHSGTGSVNLQNGNFGTLQAIRIDVAGNYSPEAIDIPTFRIDTNQSHLQALISLRESQLQVREIKFRQDKTEVLTGEITLPLDLRTPTKPETLLPPTGVVAANLVTKELKLETLPTRPNQPLPVKGRFTTNFTAQGTIDKLEANLQLQGRDLQATATPKLAPASLDLDLRFHDDALALNGTVKQPGIKPITIAGALPFPLRKILAEKKIDDQSPVQLSVKLPKSSAAFVTQLTPSVRYIEGQMSIDANLGGTIAKPVMSGAALLELPAVRFKSAGAPAINGFRGDLSFAGDKLTISRCSGDISGGGISLLGNVQFPKLTEPVFDLRITSNGALFVRNETLTVRADADVKITGPLNGATVAGSVGITKSKFFREVEILPIELPGRPAPKPPETTVGFSFPKPPLRDWKFDVAIKTKDPFLIRGNLTNGAAFVDLALVGTGRSPTLDGMVRIENFTASLPFSKLEVTYGYVYFSPDNPFVPTLDIQGTSNLRDYNISVYIYGTANEPQTLLTSEPPLPQEDIISLLATGTTAEELTGHSDVLAGRAAVLVFQKFYRKVFKKKEASENESLLSRFQLDVGGVDPRTGKQEATAKFKLAEKFYLVGDLDVQGAFRGQVKYLLRFR